MRTHFDATVVDLTKAFDTMNFDGIWETMQKFRCPERFTHIVHQLHDGVMVHVTDNVAISGASTASSETEQGCVLAPTPFNLLPSAIMMDAYRDERPGTIIAYGTDDHLLDSWRMQFPTRLSTTTVHDLLFEN
ncbi:hypothetical protein SprV_0200680200 [Sparganum proliferum]